MLSDFLLVWAGLWRKPARSILTFASTAVAFLLFGLLQGLDRGFAKAIADSQLDLLITDPRVPGGPLLPVAKRAEIQSLPGVVTVAPRATFIGSYQQPKNMLAVLATDPQSWFAVRPELVIAPAQKEMLLKTRTGVIVTPALQNHYGWRIGDKIPLKSHTLQRNGSDVWTFDLVGTFDLGEQPTAFHLAVVNYAYLDEARLADRGTADRFLVRIADPKRSTETAAAIDRLFANSPHETRTRSEREQAESRTRQLGDIGFFTSAIVGAVFFTLLFLTANTMVQSVRERNAEFAVLKTIGFSSTRVLLLVITEAFALCASAAVLGLALAALAAPSLVQILGPVTMTPAVVLSGIGTAAALSLLSAGLPGWQAARLRIVDGLGVR